MQVLLLLPETCLRSSPDLGSRSILEADVHSVRPHRSYAHDCLRPGGVAGSAIPQPPLNKAASGAATAIPSVSTAATRLPKPPSATQ